MTRAGSLLHVVEIRLPASQSAALEELLSAADLAWAGWHNPETGDRIVRIYADTADEAEAVRRQLSELLRDNADLLDASAIAIDVSTLNNEDWATVWKQHFHAFRVASHLVVKPSWEEFEGTADDIVLDIDPGMSFGTGLHGTTRACLEFLETLSGELGAVSLLDAGCGSGILSLAAVKLGFRPVAAVDHDPAAVRVAAENLARAGVDSVSLSRVDLDTVSLDVCYRVVVANILAPVLVRNAGRLAALLATDGGASRLILSGILATQYADVKACFERLGLREERRRTIDEWTSGCFMRNP